MNAGALEGLVDGLVEVLQQERRAVASLNVPAIESLTAKKADLLAEIEHAVEVPGAPEGPHIRDLVARLGIEAEANALLVRDALSVVRALLGAGSESSVYDASGALASKGRRGAARSI